MSTVTLTPAPAGRTPVRQPTCPREAATCIASVHGTYVAYQKGCRCPRGREAWRLYNKRRRQGRARPLVIDATGTRRRLQALAAIGWPFDKLAAELGYGDRTAVCRLASQATTRVNVRTAQAVRYLYKRHSMTCGPSARTRRRAERAGWPPPLAWDDADLDNPDAAPAPAARERLRLLPKRRTGIDHAAVERACTGRLPTWLPLTTQERETVVRLLHGRGLNDCQIAPRVHLSDSGVQRIRARLGLPPLTGEAGWSR